MMKSAKVLLPLVAALALAACGNLSKVTKEGTTDNPVWPNPEKTTLRHSGTQHGSWPNWDNVRMIEAGMNKDEIYNLIGRPHFNEGLYGVREWDYLFNYRENGQHKTCQYKILFDKNMDAQSFHWLPAGCGPKAKAPVVREVIIREVAAPVSVKRIRE
ncbi:lipoprotein [Neisseria weaveri]|uniref:Lipoprotein n=2 Tax=Neisseria weaveri TaxID=28091 RepID=A0A3S4Z420_9NEIS|nr:outer membrane protein assembly factor BamE [Neisseria weaveri]SAY51707.1 lipoprotein [Neisseria weaveri]VEJ51040.1 lipoprotein [Neisseria weaveri]